MNNYNVAMTLYVSQSLTLGFAVTPTSSYTTSASILSALVGGVLHGRRQPTQTLAVSSAVASLVKITDARCRSALDLPPVSQGMCHGGTKRPGCTHVYQINTRYSGVRRSQRRVQIRSLFRCMFFLRGVLKEFNTLFET